MDLLGGVEPEQLKEAMLRSVQGVGLADEVCTSPSVLRSLSTAVRSLSTALCSTARCIGCSSAVLRYNPRPGAPKP